MTLATTEAKRKTGDASKAAAAGPLSAEELRKMHAYWRAANYVCKHGDDMPEIAGWRWGQNEKSGRSRVSDTAGDNV